MTATAAPHPFPLVHATWAKVIKSGEEDESKSFGPIFYDTLFTDFPILKETSFKNVAVKQQKMNLPRFLTVAIDALTDLPAAVEALTQLGLRHVGYGAYFEAEYAVVGGNVIKTLKTILGDDLTEEATKEWLAVYGVIQKTCVDAVSSERALPFFKRLYKKRGPLVKELVTAEGLDTSKTGIATADLIAAVEPLAAEQTNEGIVKVAATLTAEQVKNFNATFTAALVAAKKDSDYDKYIANWFASEVERLAPKKTE